MMKVIRISQALSIAVMLSISITAMAQTEQTFTNSDTRAIEKVIFDYFEGVGTADRQRLGSAFHEDIATMVAVLRDSTGAERRVAWNDMSAILDRWGSNENAAGAGRDGEILSINIVDGRIATAIFRYTDRFYDAFTLLKHEEKWKISGKAFIQQ